MGFVTILEVVPCNLTCCAPARASLHRIHNYYGIDVYYGDGKVAAHVVRIWKARCMYCSCSALVMPILNPYRPPCGFPLRDLKVAPADHLLP
jgi:hypothetical protein